MEYRLQILIADDEPAARRHLLRQLQRCALPHAVVAQAASGPQLLEVARQQSVDVILLDIMMPGCSGLEALRQLQDLRPPPQVIIISAYNRFEFAQDALRLGAVDFLLKPVRYHQLQESLQRCAQAIIQRRHHHHERERYQQEAWQGLLLGERNAAVPASYQWPSPSPPLTLLAFDLPQKQREELSQRALEWASAGSGRCTLVRPGRGVILLPDAGGKIAPRERASELLAQLGEEARVAYGGPVEALEELSSYYRQACSALALAYVSGKQLMPMQEAPVPSVDNSAAQSFFALKSQLAAEVRSGSTVVALELMHQLVEQAATHPGEEVEFLSLELLSVVTLACQVASEHHQALEQLWALQNRTARRLLQGGNAEEMVEATRQCLQELFDGLEQVADNRQQLVARARALIEERCAQQLTLGQVASEVFISPYYLSHLFRELEDTTFQDCLITARMEKAQQLLRRTQLPSQAVAHQVGYASASYFSQLFKRSTGLSPSAFRKQHQPLRKSNRPVDDPSCS